MKLNYIDSVEHSRTVCPRSLGPFYRVYSLYKMGQNFLDIQYSAYIKVCNHK